LIAAAASYEVKKKRFSCRVFCVLICTFFFFFFFLEAWEGFNFLFLKNCKTQRQEKGKKSLWVGLWMGGLGAKGGVNLGVCVFIMNDLILVFFFFLPPLEC